MGIVFDLSIIAQLLENFHTITGIRYSLADVDNNLLKHSSEGTKFCEYIISREDGYERCKNCDLKALEYVKKNNVNYYTYTCHAGLVETIIPIKAEGEIVGFIFLGQLLGEQDIDQQWAKTEQLLSKWVDKSEELKQYFYELPRLSEAKINASIEILIACTFYVYSKCVIRNVSLSDFQKVNIHIEENYNKKISLDTIATTLSISKTKLCNIALKQETTINEMIRTRRLKEAKSLLANTHYSISEISLRVGVVDYNYFTKIFKAYTGLTPREYRKRIKVKE